MALPPRLKTAAKPLAAIAAAVTPTGIGVLLSVGAHGALLAFGPRTDFSFAALSQAAQEANAEETIVPLVEISPTERDRLPDFAQPRRQPPSFTGLSSRPLPSGIPFDNNARIKRPPIALNKLPSTGTNKPLPPVGQKPGPISTTLPFNSTSISGFNRPSLPPFTSGNSSTSTYIPLNPPSAPSNTTTESSSVSSDDPLPTLPSSVDTEEIISASEALEGLQARGSTPPVAPEPVVPEIPTGERNTEEGLNIPIQEGPLALATAQGDGSQIAEDSVAYSDAVTSDDDVETRIEEWYAATSEGKTRVEKATSELSVDSGFKACREQPPTDGLIGVLVNPDGSQENATILKSSGYDVVNRSALSRLGYEDFGQPDVPTQYEIEMKVIYEPEDCVEVLPEAAPAE